MPLPVKLDHCVIHVTDWERSNAFYTGVLGAELIARPVGFAYTFVFVSERGGPFTTDSFNWLVKRAGRKAKVPFQALNTRAPSSSGC